MRWVQLRTYAIENPRSVCGKTRSCEGTSRLRRYGCRRGGGASLRPQVDDLIATRALWPPPTFQKSPLRTGYASAERLGCFRCHGPGGRGASRNPGGLKGYIPPWDGRDFAELVWWTRLS